jgi:hypothetical protein
VTGDIRARGQPDEIGIWQTLPSTISEISSTTTNSIGVTSNNTSGNPHPNVQPTLIAERVVRVVP